MSPKQLFRNEENPSQIQKRNYELTTSSLLCKCNWIWLEQSQLDIQMVHQLTIASHFGHLGHFK